jgi:phage-related protein
VADETFVEQIQIQGTQEAKKQFDDLGASGERAFQRISQAATDLGPAAKVASDAFDRITRGGKDVGTAAKGMGEFGTQTKNTRAALQQFLPATQQSGTALQRLGGFLTSVIAGMKGHAAATGEAAGASKSAGREVASFGHELALLGRITGGQGGELTHLAHIVTGLGRAFAVVAPGLVALGLAKIASVGSDAAAKMADLAASTRLSVVATSALNAIGIATGVTGDKLGASIKGVNTLIKDTADKDAAAEAATRTFNQQLDDGRDTYRKTAQGLDDVAKQQLALTRGLGDGSVSLQAYIDGFDALAKQAKSVRDELAKQDETERRLIREHQLAEIAAIQNGTALQKLGINALDANGKLKKAPAVLLEIADALKGMPAGLEKSEVEFDLVAAGLDRRLLPALRQGSTAFQQIQKDAARIDPGFSDKDVEVADKYAIAVGGLSAAWDGLMNELGLGIAPAFTETLKALQNLFLSIKPGIVDFGTTVAQFVAPIITAVANTITNVVVPAFKGFFALLELIAQGINSIFGSDISGMQIFVTLLVGIVGAWGGVAVAITLVVALIGELIAKVRESGVTFTSLGATAVAVWDAIVQGAADAIQALTDGWNGWVEFFTGIWTSITGVADAVWNTIKSGAQGVVDFVVGAWNGARDAIISAFTQVQQFILQVWETIKQPVTKIFGDGNAGAQAVAAIPGKAGGGPIHGPGTGTSDSIPIWASNGEFMLRAAAVKKYGVRFLQLLNSGALRFNELGFAMGGLISAVPSPRTHFAEGGLVQSAGNTLNLTIGGKTFGGLRVPDETFDDLQRFAVKQNVASGSRKPRWKR